MHYLASIISQTLTDRSVPELGSSAGPFLVCIRKSTGRVLSFESFCNVPESIPMLLQHRPILENLTLHSFSQTPEACCHDLISPSVPSKARWQELMKQLK